MRWFRISFVIPMIMALLISCGPPRKKGPSSEELKQKYTQAVKKANMFYLKGDLSSLNKAADWYGEALKIDPKNVPLRIQRGKTFKKLSYYDRAIKEFEAALGVKPDCGNCYFYLAHLKMAMAKPESARFAQVEALKGLVEAEKLLPDDAQINLGLSDVYASMALYERIQAGKRNAKVKEYEELSFAEAEKAIEKDSTAVDAYRAMGEIYEMRKQKSKAINLYKKYIELLPEDSENRRDMEIHIDEMTGNR